MSKLLSIIVSVYNEEEVLFEFYRETLKVLLLIDNPYEIIFVNDGSVMLHEETETLREKYGKSIDAIFREEFRC